MDSPGGAGSWDYLSGTNFEPLWSELDAPSALLPIDWLDSLPNFGSTDPYFTAGNDGPQHQFSGLGLHDSQLLDSALDPAAMGPPPPPRPANDEGYPSLDEQEWTDDIEPPPTKRPRVKTKAPPPSEWKRWKETIGDLYLKQDKTLQETRQIMKDDHGFDATSQMYKDKFLDWNFKKYIPQKWTGKMSRLADERQPKDTVFELGPRRWTADEIRKKRERAKLEDEQDSPVLPTQLIIRTPSLPSPGIPHASLRPSLSPLVQFRPLSSLSRPWSPAVLPSPNSHSKFPWTTPFPPSGWLGRPLGPPALPSLHSHASSLPWLSPANTRIRQISGAGDQGLSFRFNGKSLADLERKRSYAKSLISQGEFEKAVGHLQEVLSGFHQLLSPTHVQTVDAAYQLAEILHRSDRIEEANSVLNWLSTNCVRKYGMHHEKTIKHYIKTIGLLRVWSRNCDAEFLVSKLVEILEDEDSDQSAPVIPDSKEPALALDSMVDMDLDTIFGQLEESSQLDSQLRLIGILMESLPDKADKLEEVLRRLIVFCKCDLREHILQLTRAYYWLARLHCAKGDHDKVTTTLHKAEKRLERYLSQVEDVSVDLIREARKLAFLHPNHDRCDSILQILAEHLERRVGHLRRSDDYVLLEFLIQVGVMWQQRSWELAMPWFERALAISLKTYGRRHPRTQLLDRTLEEQRFDVDAKVFDLPAVLDILFE